MSADLFDSSVDELLTLLEEGARASKRAVKRFVEPMHGTLRRAQNRRHQIVFGRRGSGKSSLPYKTAHELTEKGHPVAYVDLEPFKGHQYPDVLISVLLATLIKLQVWVAKAPENAHREWWLSLLAWRKRGKGVDRKSLLALLAGHIEDLKKQLHLTNSSKLISTTEHSTSTTTQEGARRIRSFYP